MHKLELSTRINNIAINRNWVEVGVKMKLCCVYDSFLDQLFFIRNNSSKYNSVFNEMLLGSSKNDYLLRQELDQWIVHRLNENNIRNCEIIFCDDLKDKNYELKWNL